MVKAIAYLSIIAMGKVPFDKKKDCLVIDLQI